MLLMAGAAMAEERVVDTHSPDLMQYLQRLTDAEQLLSADEPFFTSADRESFRALLLNSLASGMLGVNSNPDYPDFVPVVNNVFKLMGVNPDFIYGYTRINPEGAYRLSGYRGEALFVMIDFLAGGMGAGDTPGPSIAVLDLDRFTIAPDGYFEILLSAERPGGHTGDWFALDRRTRTLNLRQASYHWGTAQEARLALERLDRELPAPARSATADTAAVDAVTAYPAVFANFVLQYIRHLRDAGYINKLEHDDWAGRGGVTGQHYYQGLFQLAPGEVLVLETALPAEVRYWNVQLTDPLWNTIDWVNHQSSLNGAQAHIDSDGKFRAVIALEDPGAVNWLDPGGFTRGSLMLRWNEASSGPEPSLRSVPIDRLRETLPGATRYVSPAQRQVLLRERRNHALWRRRW